MQTVMDTASRSLREDHMASMAAMLSQFRADTQSERVSETESTNESVDGLRGNVFDLRQHTVSEWTDTVNLEMKALSDAMSTAHRAQKERVDELKETVSHFGSASERDHGALALSVQTESQNIAKMEQQLIANEQALGSHQEAVRKQQAQSVQFLEKMGGDLESVDRETGSFQVAQYRKSGETPTKHNVAYPTTFVESAPLEQMVERFQRENAENVPPNASLRGSRSGTQSVRSRSSRSSRSSSPYFMAEEGEINFCENELGFKIYPGD